MRDIPAGLVQSRDHVRVRPLSALTELTAGLEPEKRYWGFVLTASEARWHRRSGREWAELLEDEPWLEEARVFDEALDLHWLGDRGVSLRRVGEGEQGKDVLGGTGWLQRDRRSRLWGEELGDTGTWYEERIPNPLVYEGVEPGAGKDLVFLKYVEYVQGGEVRHVRYLGLEGEERR